jgi:hypothetical protein
MHEAFFIAGWNVLAKPLEEAFQKNIDLEQEK